jgi:hypothetical protein
VNHSVFVVALCLLSGALVEVFNSASRHWSVARLGLGAGRSLSAGRIVSGRRGSTMLFAAGFVVRLAMTSLILVLAFRQSVASGLAALVGYWICRWVVVWRMTRRLSGRKPSGGQ